MNIFKKVNLTVLALAICSLLFSGNASAMDVRTNYADEKGAFSEVRLSSSGRRTMQRYNICRKLFTVVSLSALTFVLARFGLDFNLRNTYALSVLIGFPTGLLLERAYMKRKARRRYRVIR